jgi:ribonuclease R
MAKKKSPPHKNSPAPNRQQRLFENLLKVTYEFIKGRSFSPQSKNSLAQRLQIHETHTSLFDQVLESLKEEGKIHVIGDTYHHTPPAAASSLHPGEEIVRGSISVHPRGFGFVDQPHPRGDIFIPRTKMNGAVDGDIVEVLVNPELGNEKGPEGKVTAIVERKRQQIIGTVVSQDGAEACVYSNLLGEMHPVFCAIPPNSTVQNGDRVVLDVVSWGTSKEPKLCIFNRIIGNISDPASDFPFVVTENNLRTEFPLKAIEEASSFGTKVKPSDIKGRVDLRQLECFTIDPDTAKDFDDAVSLEIIGSSYRLGVHIADASFYVRQGSALDQEASLRCNSTYFPNICIPMLPRELSENLCSLRPNVNRLTVSIFIDIDNSGNTTGWEIVRSVIKSQKRFTYKDVKNILDGKSKTVHEPTLRRMVALCNLLKERRSERGSVQLYVPEFVVKVDEKGVPTGMEIVEYDITHQLIEEFMLKANELVAVQLTKMGKDVSYRVHEEPAEESLRDFSLLVAAFGFELPPVPTPHDIQKFFLEIQDSPHAAYLATCYIKSMRLACYSPDNIGHYGLSLEHYCHFTSPIRRYVDILIHRLLLEAGPDRDTVSQMCKLASEKERLSARAEGTLISIKKLRLLSRYIEESPQKQYRAIITRVKPFGFFFDVIDLMIDGFLHISELENDYFVFDDNTSQLIGSRHNIVYRSGDHVIVMCSSVKLVMQEASWQLVGREEKETVAPPRTTHRKGKGSNSRRRNR